MSDTSKTSFGLGQVNNPTPEFANWIFRGYFIISKALIGWIAAVGLFPTKTQFVVVTTVSLLADPVVLGFSKLFGIEAVAPTDDKPFIADKQMDDKGDVKQITPVVLPPQESKPTI